MNLATKALGLTACPGYVLVEHWGSSDNNGKQHIPCRAATSERHCSMYLTPNLQSPAAMDEDAAPYPIREHIDRLKEEWSTLAKAYDGAKVEVDKGERERNQLLTHLSRVCSTVSVYTFEIEKPLAGLAESFRNITMGLIRKHWKFSKQ